MEDLGKMCIRVGLDLFSISTDATFFPTREHSGNKCLNLLSSRVLDATPWCVGRAGGWVEIGVQEEAVWSLEK